MLFARNITGGRAMVYSFLALSIGNNKEMKVAYLACSLAGAARAAAPSCVLFLALSIGNNQGMGDVGCGEI